MASDAPAGAPGRAYPYWPGAHAACCSVLFFGIIGAVGVSFLPAGVERAREGQLPTGVAMVVLGAFGVPTLALSLWYLLRGWADAVRPPLLRLTPTELVLPRGARGEPPRDEYDRPLSADPPQPEVVPLATIRRATCSGPEFNRVLELVHDGAAEPLRLHEHMMSGPDFAELLAALRAAVPAAFGNP